MQKVRIGCLTYGILDELTRKAIAKLNDAQVEIAIFKGYVKDTIDTIKSAYQEGDVEVFVGGGANASIVRENSIPIVKIQLVALDYIEALLKAKELGGKIAVVSYQKPVQYDIDKLKKYTGVEPCSIVFNNAEDLAAKIKCSGADVVVGAGLSNDVASQQALKSVNIYPGEDTILVAIQEAKQLALALRKEKERAKMMEAIIDYTLSGIIATDENGKVIIYNPHAEKILGKSRGIVIGQHAYEVYPELASAEELCSDKTQIGNIRIINDTQLYISRIPVDDGRQVVGNVTIFQKVAEIQKTEQRIRLLNKQKGFTAKADFSNIIGKSKVVRTEIEKAKLYAKTNSNILIYGETGVGKEIFAQSMHNYSLRADGPFVAVNCAALPENLLISELFGYEEGAFTGSRRGGKSGLFEMAHQGTIFLDEIAEISPALQAQLLRVVQEKEVMKIGGDRVIPIDVRIISATNKRLEDKMPDRFREDLYYRLNVFHLIIPPLRQRKEDIMDLFVSYVKRFTNSIIDSDSISQNTMHILNAYSWPGNIRELQNVAERFALLLKNANRVNGEVIREILVSAINADRLFDDIVRQFDYKKEKKGKDLTPALLAKLEEVFPRNKSWIAEKLGISRTTLWRA